MRWVRTARMIASGTHGAFIRFPSGFYRPWGKLMHTENGHIVETAVEARAGFLGRPTLVVLVVSTILVVALFVIAGSYATGGGLF